LFVTQQKPRRAIVIYNPHSGACRRRDRAADVAAFVAQLEARGFSAQTWSTKGPGDASALARRAVESGEDVIVASGGDGTLNEVLQGIVGSRISLAIWPCGTANVLAREIKIQADAAAIARMVYEGKQRRISIGHAVWSGGERFFFLMAGVGLDASVVRALHPVVKARWGEGAFWLAGLQHMVAWRPQAFWVQLEERRYKSAFTVVGNAATYAGGFRITPHARMDEALLDVCIYPLRAFAWQYSQNIVASWRGRRHGGVVYRKTESVRMEPLAQHRDNPPWVQVDGELLAPLPMRFEIMPDALTILVP
jgi:YegS/Rv2252/BmrU family lipid kinase